ncbi:MAG: hypothetical protein A2W22_04440 [Candidatus Levybacteria bacterium RBG_16_35_11]|nr:MAG: hypothetical protein A2W22_04440 [Candidatus Levybacteria bacterium RBG_16_35_11]
MRRFILLFILILLLVFLYLFFQKNISSPSKTPQKIQTTGVENQKNVDISETLVIAKELDTPWEIVFLPNKDILITERPGRVRIMNSGILNPKPVATFEKVREIGEGGLLGMTLHPKFESNNYIYFYYTYGGNLGSTLNRVVRMTYKNNVLSNEKIIVDNIPGNSNHNGGRIKFGPDNYLYITTGDAQNPSQAQNTNTLGGKILRVTDSGEKVKDNPFTNLVYSYGHRNPQGLAWDKNGNLWETEHGPSGLWPNCCQDELNKIIKGGNYGWPESVGDKVLPETIAPILQSGGNTWAPSGTAFFSSSVFFAGLRGKTLYEAFIQGDQAVLREHLKGSFGRIRNVTVGPDKMLYISTSNRDGRGNPAVDDDRIIKINPAKL